MSPPCLLPESSNGRKDSGFTRSSSSLTLGSSNGASTTEPRCSEHFHHKDTPPCEIRRCMGTNHATPYYVCITCMMTARSWHVTRPRSEEDMPLIPVITGTIPLPLCETCTAAASRGPSPVAAVCRCMHPTTAWFCLECADVSSWSGIVQMKDLGEREQKVWAQIPRHEQAVVRQIGVCPGCEDVFVPTEAGRHAFMCMVCKDIFRDHPIDPTTTTRREDPGHTPFSALKSPKWSGRATKLRVPDENIAPDAVPAAAHQGQVVKATQVTQRSAASSSHGAGWTFPRSSGVKIGPPTEGANAASDAQTRHILRQHFNGGKCMVGAHSHTGSHTSSECYELDEGEEMTRFVQDLVDTEQADNKELGIEAELGTWIYQTSNI